MLYKKETVPKAPAKISLLFEGSYSILAAIVPEDHILPHTFP